jgi:hypothetical protein
MSLAQSKEKGLKSQPAPAEPPLKDIQDEKTMKDIRLPHLHNYVSHTLLSCLKAER